MKTTQYFHAMGVRPDQRQDFQAMKIRYFEDTDTLYIEFSEGNIVETRDLDENTIIDVDSEGRISAITLEHASQRTDLRHLTLEGLAAA